MDPDTAIALCFRFGMVGVYLLLFRYFYSGYKNSIQGGFRNTFFLGFSILFTILVIFHIVYGTFELLSALDLNPLNLKSEFPWNGLGPGVLGEFSNQARPMFLIFYFIMNLVLVSIIFPLEQAIGWKKTPVSKIMVVCGFSLWILFVPVLTYSYVAIAAIILGFTGIGLGIICSIGVNIRLSAITTGALKRQSIFAIFAFLCLAVGLTWAMEVGWGRDLFGLNSYKWDVVIGSIVQGIGGLFYRLGFITEKKKNSELKGKKP
ncbi:MAG: hypothetical protein JW839_18350 [Candidatus Lokiarchaeota archaeon]|nr:hypothetical protein [Candidatus Lokiarchaeota archaeon]